MRSWLWVLGYGLLLLYGSLFPFEHLAWDTQVDARRLLDWKAAQGSYSAADLLVNLLVYLPWGGLVAVRLTRMPLGLALAATIVSGFALSFAIEYLQLFFPARVPSLGDVAMNTLGTALGALIGTMLQRLPQGEQLKAGYRRLVLASPLADLGALVLACWALAELTPLVLSLDFGNLKQGIKPLWKVLQGTRQFNEAKAWVAFVDFAALGLVLRSILCPGAPFWRIFWAVFGGVLLAKVPVVGRQLSLEASVGLAGAAVLVGLLTRLKGASAALLGIGLIVSGLVVSALMAENESLGAQALNWIPFARQQHGIVGLIDILLGIWPCLALGFFSQALVAAKRRLSLAILGSGAVFALALYLEWRQQFIPGRYPDATDAYLALAACGYASRRTALACWRLSIQSQTLTRIQVGCCRARKNCRTPVYINHRCGRGSFYDYTCRVEK